MSTIALRLAEGLDPRVAARVQHAFDIAVPVLGLRSVPLNDAAIILGYGCAGDVQIAPTAPTNLLRPVTEVAPQPILVPAGIDKLPAFHPTEHGQLDHLAEIFEWTSGLHELAVSERDDVGRIPSGRALPQHAGLAPETAWASRVIDDLRARIVESRPELTSALAMGDQPTVAVSHDLDFYCRSNGDVAHRALRSLLAAARRRDTATVRRTLGLLARNPLQLRRRFETVDDLVRLDRSHGVEATWVIIARKAHRRDANYELDDIIDALRELDESCDLAVHGSYTSLETPNGLAEEFQAMRSAGLKVSGGRQHWLRFCDHQLFHALERAGATWDSSAGFSDCVGFRHGIASPYRLWDPTSDRPSTILQIPLVMMDMALDALHRSGADWRAAAETVLDELESVPGSAASVLWHDTVFSGVQTNPAIVDLYRTVIRKPYRWKSLSALAQTWGDPDQAGADIHVG